MRGKRKRTRPQHDPGELADPADQLTTKQAKFVGHIMEDLTQAEAYRRAGYKCSSPAAAWVGASVLIRVPKIRRAINLAMESAMRRAEVTTELWFRRLWWEATREGPGSSHSARVSALVKIGQRLGALTPDSVAGDGSKELEAIVSRVLAAGKLGPRQAEAETPDEGE